MQRINTATLALRLGAAATLGACLLLAVHYFGKPLPSLGVLLASATFPALLSLAVFVNTDRSLRSSQMAFMQAVVLGLMAKLFVSMAWVGLLAWLTPVSRLQLAFVYLGAFLVYTTLEVHALLNNLRAEKTS